MKFIRSSFAPFAMMLLALASLQACKAKKIIQKPAPVAQTPPPPPAAPVKHTVEPPKPKPIPVEKPDYNFSNIQFEFNSGILKTSSYPILDKAAAAMKMDASVKFNLNGYASIEGTEAHNLQLSKDRANAVKEYLINSGVSADNLTSTGYGTKNPIADNSTESGKVLNRRVEIHKTN
jgi:OOP family OmpA-OmpF porin